MKTLQIPPPPQVCDDSGFEIGRQPYHHEGGCIAFASGVWHVHQPRHARFRGTHTFGERARTNYPGIECFRDTNDLTFVFGLRAPGNDAVCPSEVRHLPTKQWSRAIVTLAHQWATGARDGRRVLPATSRNHRHGRGLWSVDHLVSSLPLFLPPKNQAKIIKHETPHVATCEQTSASPHHPTTTVYHARICVDQKKRVVVVSSSDSLVGQIRGACVYRRESCVVCVWTYECGWVFFF